MGSYREGARALVLTAVLALGLGACGPGTDQGGAPTTDQVRSTEETTMTSSPDRHQAARAERPTTDALVREVAARLTPQDPDEVAAEDWVHGSTAACSWQAGGPVSWTSRGQMRATDPEVQVLTVVESLDPRWERVETSATTATHFKDAQGYLLTLAWGTDPDHVTVSVESPCYA